MTNNDDQNRFSSRLLVIIALSWLVALVLGWYLVYRIGGDNPTITLISAVISNLLTSLFIALILYVSFGKRMLDIDKVIATNQQHNNEWQKTIDDVITNRFATAFTTLEAIVDSVKSIEEKIDMTNRALASVGNAVHTSGEEMARVKEQVQQVTEQLHALQPEKLLSDIHKIQQAQRGKKVPEYESLAGYWIEYIENRRNEGCHFSIAKFEFDESEGQYCFSGTSYDLLHKRNQYKWKSVLVLDPIKISDNKFFIYYFYRRDDSIDHMGKYGIGKLVAKKEGNSFVLTQGFFFNEVTRQSHFNMVLKKMPDIANALNITVDGQEENKQRVMELLTKLNQTGIYEAWEFNEHDDIDERNFPNLVRMAAR